MINKFTKSFTAANKGVALLLLLWHHLFGIASEYGHFIQHLAGVSKVCVAIFLILSGYGLNEATRKKTPLFFFTLSVYLNCI